MIQTNVVVETTALVNGQLTTVRPTFRSYLSQCSQLPLVLYLSSHLDFSSSGSRFDPFLFIGSGLRGCHRDHRPHRARRPFLPQT